VSSAGRACVGPDRGRVKGSMGGRKKKGGAFVLRRLREGDDRFTLWGKGRENQVAT